MKQDLLLLHNTNYWREVYMHLQKTKQAFCFSQATGQMLTIGDCKTALDLN